ncbi:MAG: hypothetical protein M9951_03620 [Burkholderiaceae bacterium]|jgi:hypothetical protein|nr:hypothetical protein [Burkholderiaceae bacterium]MEB2319894.1 hypothetical protein [Pseudomonadota bacterium]
MLMGLLAIERPLLHRHGPLHGLPRSPSGGFEAIQFRNGTGHEISDPCGNRHLLIERQVPDPAQGLFIEAQGDVARHGD